MADLWAGVDERFRAGTWRDRIFLDLLLEDIRARGPRPTVLDIGCGHGLDGNAELQQEVARHAGRFLGVEPDAEIRLHECFTEAHHCLLEDAPIAPGSVDVAYCVMVLEHLPRPQVFWDRLHALLADGGVFWGMTVDGRHPFSTTSRLMEVLKLKGVYMDLLLGKRGVERIENYPTFYRSNSPEVMARLGGRFRDVQCHSMNRPGLFASNFPRPLRPAVDLLERGRMRRGRPGILLLTRAEK
jgi:SAM-dependent methyltransferase